MLIHCSGELFIEHKAYNTKKIAITTDLVALWTQRSQCWMWWQWFESSSVNFLLSSKWQSHNITWLLIICKDKIFFLLSWLARFHNITTAIQKRNLKTKFGNDLTSRSCEKFDYSTYSGLAKAVIFWRHTNRPHTIRLSRIVTPLSITVVLPLTILTKFSIKTTI